MSGMSKPPFVTAIANIAKYVGDSCEELEWIAEWGDGEKVFDLCHKTLEEMVSIVIKSGQGYHIRWLKEDGAVVISIYIAAEKLYVVRAIKPRVSTPKKPLKYMVFIEEGDYTEEKIAMLEKKYGITTTIYGMPLTPKTSEQQADVVK
jgi:uncharacterized protein GlcG (DUF336 family)